MLHRSHTPASPLADFIEDFWLYDDYRPEHLKERILPSGTIELVINLRDNEFRIYDRVRPGLCQRFSGAIVSGAYNGFFVIDTAEEASVLDVHFKPGGAFPFFALPVSELIDTHVDLETLWGRPARELRDRLRGATAPIDKFRVLEAALLAHLPGSLMHHDAVRFALDAFSRPSLATVRDVTERVGLSHRRFHRGLQGQGRCFRSSFRAAIHSSPDTTRCSGMANPPTTESNEPRPNRHRCVRRSRRARSTLAALTAVTSRGLASLAAPSRGRGSSRPSIAPCLRRAAGLE